MSPPSREGRNLLAVNIGLAANVLLAVLKTAVGIAGHSPALLADGINSTSDVAYLIIVRIFMGLAGKPPDREHPLGHRQLESIAALVIGAFVIAAAIAIFWNAIDDVFDMLTGAGDRPVAEPAALWVALFTFVVKVGLTVFTFRVGRKTGSIAVLALAQDHRNDVFSISTATIGIILGRTGYAWLDPLAAAMVALVILYTGISILRDSSADLMDILPNQKIYEHMRQLVQSVPGVDELEEIHVHKIGFYLLVDVTIGVDGRLTVQEGDGIASRVEQILTDNIEYLRHISVHYHPSRAHVNDAAAVRSPGKSP